MAIAAVAGRRAARRPPVRVVLRRLHLSWTLVDVHLPAREAVICVDPS